MEDSRNSLNVSFETIEVDQTSRSTSSSSLPSTITVSPFNDQKGDAFQQHLYNNRAVSVDSVTSMATTGSSGMDPPPSTQEEKMRLFRSYITLVSSCIYGVFVVTFGTIIFIQSLITSKPTWITDAFAIYLVTVGLAFFIFLKFEVKRYVVKMKSRREAMLPKFALPENQPVKDLVNDCEQELDKDLGERLEIETITTDSTEKRIVEDGSSIHHDFCFTMGRHSGSFYLKSGAAVFCFGLLIHSGCIICYQVVNLHQGSGCGSVLKVAREILHSLYALFQLYFIFKHSNVIINRCKGLARFALMHCIATSICFWIWTILEETVHSINTHGSHGSDHAENSSNTTTPDHNVHTTQASVDHEVATSEHAANESCQSSSGMALTFNNFAPFMYPFTIEYSILIAGILFIIWQNVGNCSDDLSDPEDGCNFDVEEYNDKSNLMMHADCHSSNKGLFGGLIVLAASIISIIIFSIVAADKENLDVGIEVNDITDITIVVLMILAAAVAYRQIVRLDVSSHPTSQLDDLLLFFCIPAYFMYAIFSLAVENVPALEVTKIVLQVLQVIIQTPLIMDGLRRCSNSRHLRTTLPAKELVTFLIICNIAMWVTETFQIKETGIIDYRVEAYGTVFWILIQHMTVPLQMFYRFHSSVCLVDIWMSAYKRE